MTDRCIRCPTPPEIRCRGLDVRRFCELIDPSGSGYDPGYERVILSESHRLAGIAAPIPPAEAAELLARMRACPFRSIADGGCQCGRCGLRTGAAVHYRECFACLTRYP
jgi:hypothetical protein